MIYHLLFNGEFYAEPAHIISPSNSGFRYGEGLFETMRVVNGNVHLATHHIERLFHGMQILGFKIPPNFSSEYLLSQVQRLLTKNSIIDARVRLCIAGNNQLTGRSDLTFDLIIQCSPLSSNYFQLNNKGLNIGICRQVKKSCDILSNLKSNNYLPMLLAARYSEIHGLDDSLILNHQGNIVESTISNVFIVKNNAVLTPPLQDGPVAGVMRRHILETLSSSGVATLEQSITLDQLKEAEEVFLSNAITGIRWVKEFEDIHYSNETSLMLYPKLFNER